MLNWFKTLKTFASGSAGATPQTNSSTDTSTPKYNGVAPKQWWDKIEFVFASGGVNYFRIVSPLNLPYERFYAALDIYDELEFGLNPGVLMKSIQALQAICTNPKIKTIEKMKMEVGILAHGIQERINIHHQLSTHMKLATVRYFDETENIFTYDHAYNQKKIQHWASNHDVQDFFFMQPIQNFVPDLTGFQENLATYLQGECVQLLSLLKIATQFDTSESTNPELQSYLQLQEETLEIIKNWAGSRSTSIAS